MRRIARPFTEFALSSLPRPASIFIGLCLALALAGCGGGGDGGASPVPGSALSGQSSSPPGGQQTGGSTGSTAQPPSTPPPATITAALLPYVNDERLAFEWLNEQRRAAGLPTLAQSAALDAAARDHADYLTRNAVVSHTQSAVLPGFTGVSPTDRAQRYGYLGYVIEGIAQMEYAVSNIESLMSMPYHRVVLMADVQDVGLRRLLATQPNANPAMVVLTGLRGADAPPARTAEGGVSLYPANGMQDVPIAKGPEWPNPVPEVYDLDNPATGWGTTGPNGLRIPGYTVSLSVPPGRRLTVTSFTLTRVDGVAAGSVAPVAARVIDRNDPIWLREYGIAHWAFLVPLRPLEPGATYEAAFVGSIDGTAAAPTSLTRTWRFSVRGGDGQATLEPRVVRDTALGTVSLHYRMVSGHVGFEAIVEPVNCGAGTVISQRTAPPESVILTTTGTPPLPGCQARVTVIDKVTGRRDVRLVPMS